MFNSEFKFKIFLLELIKNKNKIMKIFKSWSSLYSNQSHDLIIQKTCTNINSNLVNLVLK